MVQRGIQSLGEDSGGTDKALAALDSINEKERNDNGERKRTEQGD